jgi:hypothetical protein
MYITTNEDSRNLSSLNENPDPDFRAVGYLHPLSLYWTMGDLNVGLLGAFG